MSDSICTEILACTDCKRNYKIIAKELAFYRAMQVPLPRNCPLCRHLKRFKRKTVTNLWTGECGECRKQVATAFAPEQAVQVLCDDCYFAKVY